MRRAGFTLLELLVVICIVAVLALHLNRRLQLLQVDAEHAAVEHVVGTLRSAVALEVASHVLRGEPASLRVLLDTNPMDRLAERPGNYLGELDAPDPTTVPGGQWYFDRGERVLIYRVRHGEFVETPLPGPSRIRFKYRLLTADSTPDGEFEPHGQEIRGLTLTAVEPYRWLDPRGAKKDQTS